MDKEDFLAWKDQPATQWVLERLLLKAQELEEQCRSLLYQSTGNSPEEWSLLQSRAGFDRGVVTGLNFLINLELEEIHEQPERDHADRI
jgi:hypothetical protein